MSWPSTVTVPPDGVTMPQTALMSVVFPAPLGPSSAKISPRPIWRSIALSATNPEAYVLVRPLMVTIGSMRRRPRDTAATTPASRRTVPHDVLSSRRYPSKRSCLSFWASCCSWSSRASSTPSSPGRARRGGRRSGRSVHRDRRTLRPGGRRQGARADGAAVGADAGDPVARRGVRAALHGQGRDHRGDRGRPGRVRERDHPRRLHALAGGGDRAGGAVRPRGRPALGTAGSRDPGRRRLLALDPRPARAPARHADLAGGSGRRDARGARPLALAAADGRR